MDQATLSLFVNTAFRIGARVIEARMDKPLAEASNAELLAVLREIDIRTPAELIAESAGKPDHED